MVFEAVFLDGDGPDGPVSTSESMSLVSSVRNNFSRRAPGEAACAVVILEGECLITLDWDIAGGLGWNECSGIVGAETACNEDVQEDVDAESAGAEDADAIGLRGRGL